MQPPPVPNYSPERKLISIATVFAKPGKEDRLASLISEIKAEARTEKGTLTYRTTAKLGTAGEFLIFEEYTGQIGLEEHYKGKAFTAMGKVLAEEDIIDGGRGGIKIEYYKEL